MVDIALCADAGVDEIVSELDKLVDRQQNRLREDTVSTSSRSRGGVYTRFDDYFARLGDSELRQMRPKRLGRAKHQSPTLVRE